MDLYKIEDLKPHSQNNYYFDDIVGDSWNEFLQSVKTSGVIEPIVITQNKIIVSGHQRVRACKTLGIKEVKAEVRIFDSDDEILKCLIETNIRQRGIGNTNPVKFGRCLKELERIYGIRDGSANEKGNNRIGEPQIADDQITQSDLASQLGISVDTLNRYKQLADAIPEIQTLIETGTVTPTTARAIIKKLPEEQQRELANQLFNSDRKFTGKEIDKEIERINLELNERDLKIKSLETDKEERENYIHELENREPTVITKTIEVVPSDYETLKKSKESSAKDYKYLESLWEKDKEKIKELQQRINDLEQRSDIEELQKKLEEETGFFMIRTYEYIQKNGGYVWITEKMNQLPEKQRKEFINTIYAIDAFAKQMVENIGGYGIE